MVRHSPLNFNHSLLICGSWQGSHAVKDTIRRAATQHCRNCRDLQRAQAFAIIALLLL